jgi:hypothetical protein
VFSVPSPVEATMLLEDFGITYDPQLINDPATAESYTRISKKAYNLGVYNTDISYAMIHEQIQPAFELLDAAKELSGDLGVEELYSHAFLNKLEASIADKDSLVSLINKTYTGLYTEITEAGTAHLAGLAIAGAWTEGMYLSLTLSEDHLTTAKGQEVIDKQKEALKELLDMLEPHKDQSDVAHLLQKMNPINAAFKDLDQAQTKREKQAVLQDVLLKVESFREEIVAID